MIRLDTQYKSMLVALSGAVTSLPLDCTLSYVDRGKPDLDSLLPRMQTTKISKTGAGSQICDPPSAAAIREIDSIIICNTDSVAATLTVNISDSQSGLVFGQLVCTLQAGEMLSYTDSDGWSALDVNGSWKTILPATSIPWDTPGAIGATTPNTGAFTTLAATSLNKVTITSPAAGSTLTIANGKTLTANSTLTLAGTDGKSLTINASLTLAGTDATTMTFPATSATLARTDAGQTFTGANVFSNAITGAGGGLFTSPTAGLGYGTGAGGAVTQLTSKATTVTLNKTSGQITTHNAALAAGATAAFVVNNSTVAATDTVIANIANVGGSGTNAYAVFVNSVVATAFVLGLQNISGGPLSEAVVINFTIIKGVAA